jgi:hypothetical protein
MSSRKSCKSFRQKTSRTSGSQRKSRSGRGTRGNNYKSIRIQSSKQSSNQIPVHIITVLLPSIDTKLDDLHKQGAQLNMQLSRDMDSLMKCVQKLHHEKNDNGVLLQAMEQWFTWASRRRFVLVRWFF